MSSTDGESSRPDPGLQPWHFYLLLSLMGATAAVLLSRNTHPAALALMSLGVVAAGAVAAAVHQAISGFMGLTREEIAPLDDRTRAAIERDKALVLRSIKELEFDRSMGKISEEDFAEISVHLRTRALSLIEELERADAALASLAARRATGRGGKVMRPRTACPACQTDNEPDARFCKACGGRLA